MRCFVAIELDQTLHHPLARMLREQLSHSRDVRWCGPQQLHVTLKFLGEARDEQLTSLCEAISAASEFIEPFSIRMEGLGCFPTPRNPKVIWCGLDDPERGCTRWLDLADPLFVELGFQGDTRAYHPHITLGRAKTPAGAKLIRETLDQVEVPAVPAMKVMQVVLFESRFAPTGARYTPRFKARLGR